LALLVADYSEKINSEVMPLIENAQETLKDIYQQTSNTPVIQWIYENAELPKFE